MSAQISLVSPASPLLSSEFPQSDPAPDRKVHLAATVEDTASVVTRWLTSEFLGTESWNLANLGRRFPVGVIRLGLDAGLRSGPGRAGKPSILKLSEAFRFAPMVR